MPFTQFLTWLGAYYAEEKNCITMGGRSSFTARLIPGENLLLIGRSSGKNSSVDEAILRRIFDRYQTAAENDRHKTSFYTDPVWQDTPDRINAPYAAALIKEWSGQ